MKQLATVCLLGSGLLCAAPPAQAQMVQFDAVAVGGACTSSGADCSAVVADILGQLGAMNLAPDEYHTQLAVLVAIVAEAAARAPALAPMLGQIIAQIAGYSTDPMQRANMTILARQVSMGSFGIIDLATAVSASPN